MDKRSILQKVKEVYSHGENMMLYLNKNSGKNTVEDIMISYDFQAGTAITNYNERGMLFQTTNARVRELVKAMKELNIEKVDNILEAGVGDATLINNLLSEIQYNKAYGFDLSWSRVYKGMQYVKQTGIKNLELFEGDLFHIPLKDESMDIVYTVEAVEPNSGHEREILQELYRVSRKYVFLVEPSYELVGEEARKRMEKLGYVQNIHKEVETLGYNIIFYKLLPQDCYPERNPVALMIIKKDISRDNCTFDEDVFQCPISGCALHEYDDSFYSEDSMLAYPKIKEVPILLESSAVVATKYNE